MKLLDALKIVNQSAASNAPKLQIALNCGFTPLHVETFLAARVAQLNPHRSVRVTAGLYGDLAGNFERIDLTNTETIVALMEWADLDARLGIRSSGGWEPEKLPDITQSASAQLERIQNALRRVHPSIVLSLPSLPLPPIAYSRPSCIGSFEADLRTELARFVQSVAAFEHVRIVSPDAVNRVSSSQHRLDVKSELTLGFPYTLEHAEALAGLIAREITVSPRKKGIITDLDDTLWRGILGEEGASGVCWTVDRKAHAHGLYQQLLSSLAASGTLVAIASKNNPELVEEVWKREDLLLPKTRIFPIEINWGPKSNSVARILEAWNISADSVIFVDDSPLELAEVQAAFPEIECLLFPKDDASKLWNFLFELREKCGTNRLTSEDSLRLDSLRAHAQREAEQRNLGGNEDDFLRSVEAEITFLTSKDPDARALELINKTNQFNLNGERLTEAQWNALLSDPRYFILKVGYRDRFGPLGTIAVLVGSADNDSVVVEHWVMSCRAFSRRIEHRSLKWVFDRFSAGQVILQFRPTPRNEPTQNFLASFLGELPDSPLTLSRALFEGKCPPLYHSVKEASQ